MENKIIEEFAVADRRPIMCDGDRNHYCPYYSDCLDIAINKKWESWNCCGCNLKDIDVIDVMRKIEQKKPVMLNHQLLEKLTEELQPYF